MKEDKGHTALIYVLGPDPLHHLCDHLYLHVLSPSLSCAFMRALFWPSALYLLVRVSGAPTPDTDDAPASALRIKSEKSWLWGWAWGAESTVSIVDRSPIISFASRPAAFGAEINDPILGYVIPLSSFTRTCAANSTFLSSANTGCPSLCVDGPYQPDPSETWIALVQRGGCEFVKKVREAQRLGAHAVVVGGEDPELTGYPDTLVNMYSPEDASDIKIASTYIKYSDYEQLSSLIAASNTSHSGLRTLSLLITAEYSAWEWYSPIITFIVILLLPSVLTFITLLIHRIRAARAAQRDRAPQDVVRNLPWRVWTGSGWEKHGSGEDPYAAEERSDAAAVGAAAAAAAPVSDNSESSEGSSSTPADPKPLASSEQTASESPLPWFDTQVECAICLSEFEKGDKVRVLPCHHMFHLAEVDEWLIQRKKLCPVCKADVTQPPPEAKLPGPAVDGAVAGPSRAGSPAVTERTPLLANHDQDDDPL